MRRIRHISADSGIIIAAALGLAVCALCCALLIEGSVPHGHFTVSVADAYSLSPISGALVVIPEAKLSSVTDGNGNAFIFGIPAKAMRTGTSDGLRKVTVLVKAEGYLPYAMFYVSVYPGTMRRDVAAYMFEPATDDAVAIVTFVESPDEDFALDLFERCTK